MDSLEEFKSLQKPGSPNGLEKPEKSDTLDELDFTRLQVGIRSLPQELQDDILKHLLKIHLLRGRIMLDGDGQWMSSGAAPSLKPNLSIMYALDKQRLAWAKTILYRTRNSWVMFDGFISCKFFDTWDREDLRLLSHVELQPLGLRDIYRHYRHYRPGPDRVYFRLGGIQNDSVVGYRGCLLGSWAYKRISLEELQTRGPLDACTELELAESRLPIARLPGCHPPKRMAQMSEERPSHAQTLFISWANKSAWIMDFMQEYPNDFPVAIVG